MKGPLMIIASLPSKKIKPSSPPQRSRHFLQQKESPEYPWQQPSRLRYSQMRSKELLDTPKYNLHQDWLNNRWGWHGTTMSWIILQYPKALHQLLQQIKIGNQPSHLR